MTYSMPPHDPRFGATPPPPWSPGGGQPGGAQLATAGQRFGARIIDYVIIAVGSSVLMFGLMVVVFMATDSDDFGAGDNAVFAFWFLFSWGLWLFLYDWFCLMAWGRTAGKAMVGIKVVSTDGGPLTQGQGLGRSALFGLPQVLTCVGPAFILIESLIGAGQPHGQSLHDRAASTLVVRTR